MQISIDELRVSFIWLEPTPLLLSPNSKAPMAFMGKRATYMQQFDKAQASESVWTAPWPGTENYIHRFWSRYLELGLRSIIDVDGEHCWDYIVPLRQHIDVRVKAIVASVVTSCLVRRMLIEAFYYPHAFGVVITLYLVGESSLLAMIDRAIEIRSQARYESSLAPKPVNLDLFASRVLDRVRKTALGRAAKPGRIASSPFSIATVIRGSGVSSELPRDKSDIHLANEALCSWNPRWLTATPHDLGDCSLPVEHSADARLLYALERGRSVWFPDAFTEQDRLHKLSCYHRNLTLLSMQVESLIAMVKLADRYVASGQIMPAAMQTLTKRAVVILGLLYGGVSKSYASWSSVKQLDDSGEADTIDRIRYDPFGLPPLHLSTH